jgi:integrase
MKGSIRERSPGHWAIIFDVFENGKRKRRWHSFKGTKEEAEVERSRLIVARAEATYVDPSKLTLEQYLSDRIAQWTLGRKIGNKSAERYRELLNNQIAEHVGHIRLQKLKAIDVENWHNQLIAKGLSTRTIQHAHGLLNKAFRQAAKFGLVIKNVVAETDRPKSDIEEVQIIGQDRLPELLEKLRGSKIYPQAMLALFCGLRRGELLALKWKHVDLEKKLVRIEVALEQTKEHGVIAKAPKTRSGKRSVGLPDVVVDALQRHRQAQLELRLRLGQGKLSDETLLFSTIDGGYINPRVFSCSTWPRFAQSIGMADIKFHALRHTHASQLIHDGVDIVEISKRLGHSKPTITLNVYAHLYGKSGAVAADNAARARLGS